MRWRLSAIFVLPAALLLAVSLPGPASHAESNPDAPSGTAQAQDQEPIPWDLIDCQFVYGIVPVAGPRVQPYLPEGFQVGSVVQIGIEGNVCASGHGLTGPVPGMQYASFWMGITPPEQLRVPDGGAHFVNWDVLIPDADRRQALAATGIPARNGSVEIQDTSLGGVASQREVTLTLEGNGVFRLVFPLAQANPGASGGRFTQYTQGDGQLVRWTTDWEVEQAYSAQGIAILEPGSWQAEMFGSAVMPALVRYGTWDYTDGMIVPGVVWP